VGVHLAAALPQSPWIEYSILNWNALVETPVQFEQGYALAPEQPGHGLRLSESARAQYAQPEVGDVSRMPAPPSPISLPPA
jgi:L-alanine-DL-glutamate epimerase-like enolase superfamily enzyme